MAFYLPLPVTNGQHYNKGSNILCKLLQIHGCHLCDIKGSYRGFSSVIFPWLMKALVQRFQAQSIPFPV